MAFFNPEAYELLLQRVRATQMKDDLEIVRDTSNDCLKYVWTVCEGENRLNTADRPAQIMVGDYDSKRHNAHENAISSVAVMNRLVGQYAITAAFTGDLKDRHQVADFCLELVNWLFQNRRKEYYERHRSGENKRRIFPEKCNLNLVLYRSFSGNYREI